MLQLVLVNLEKRASLRDLIQGWVPRALYTQTENRTRISTWLRANIEIARLLRSNATGKRTANPTEITTADPNTGFPGRFTRAPKTVRVAPRLALDLTVSIERMREMKTEGAGTGPNSESATDRGPPPRGAGIS